MELQCYSVILTRINILPKLHESTDNIGNLFFGNMTGKASIGHLCWQLKLSNLNQKWKCYWWMDAHFDPWAWTLSKDCLLASSLQAIARDNALVRVIPAKKQTAVASFGDGCLKNAKAQIILSTRSKRVIFQGIGTQIVQLIISSWRDINTAT